MKLVGKTQAVMDMEAQAAKDADDEAQTKADLAANEQKALRALIAVTAGSAVKGDYDMIKQLDNEATRLRKKITRLGA